MRLYPTIFIFIFVIFISQWIEASENKTERSFQVDFINNRFLKDGKPFQFVSGQFDYFRAVPEKWRHILRTMRASGLNVVSTYVPWSTHNPHDGQYVWTDMADVEKFIRMAIEEDFLVMLRTSPYIGGERTLVGVHFSDILDLIRRN